MVCPARGKSNYIELELFWNIDSDNQLLTHKTLSCQIRQQNTERSVERLGSKRTEGMRGSRVEVAVARYFFLPVWIENKNVYLTNRDELFTYFSQTRIGGR